MLCVGSHQSLYTRSDAANFSYRKKIESWNGTAAFNNFYIKLRDDSCLHSLSNLETFLKSFSVAQQPPPTLASIIVRLQAFLSTNKKALWNWCSVSVLAPFSGWTVFVDYSVHHSAPFEKSIHHIKAPHICSGSDVYIVGWKERRIVAPKRYD